MSKLFYLASALANVGPARKLIAELEKHGWSCTYDWTLQWEKELKPDAIQDLRGLELKREILNAELNGVMEADVLILFLPGGRGAHVEFGAALAQGIPVLIIYADEGALKGGYNYDCIFYLHEDVRKVSFFGEPNAHSVAIHLEDMLAELETRIASSLG